MKWTQPVRLEALVLGLLLTLGLALQAEAQVSFKLAGQIPLGKQPMGLVAGDFDNDRDVDLAMSTADSVTVFLGVGDGSFGTANDFPIATEIGGPRRLVTEDFNRDGALDLAAPTSDVFLAPNAVSVLLGAGDGSFGAATDFGVGTEPLSLATGDFNGDEIADLAVANQFSDDVSILLGTGTGSFATATNFAAGDGPFSLAIADLNGDAKLDLAVANIDGSAVSILLGTGTGSFGSPLTFPAGPFPRSLAIGDFNRDAKLDIVVASGDVSNTVTILLGDGTGSFGSDIGSFLVGEFPNLIKTADLNGDGNLDLVVARNFSGGRGSNAVSILLGEGNGSFALPVQVFSVPEMLGGVAMHVAIADLNGDGKPDLALADNDFEVTVGVGHLSILLNTTPFFVFIPHFDTTIGQWATGVAVANVGPASTTATVEAFDSSGTSLGTTTPPDPGQWPDRLRRGGDVWGRQWLAEDHGRSAAGRPRGLHQSPVGGDCGPAGGAVKESGIRQA